MKNAFILNDLGARSVLEKNSFALTEKLGKAYDLLPSKFFCAVEAGKLFEAAGLIPKGLDYPDKWVSNMLVKLSKRQYIFLVGRVGNKVWWSKDKSHLGRNDLLPRTAKETSTVKRKDGKTVTVQNHGALSYREFNAPELCKFYGGGKLLFPVPFEFQNSRGIYTVTIPSYKALFCSLPSTYSGVR